jgi:pilus assembly protein TadC
MISLTVLLVVAAALAAPSRQLAAMRRLRRLSQLDQAGRSGAAPSAVVSAAEQTTGKGPATASARAASPTALATRPGANADTGLGRYRPLLAAGIAGLAVVMLLGSWTGAVVGLVVAVLSARFLSRLEPRATRLRREQIDRDRVLAADLMAACLTAGASPVDAAAAVVDALGGPVGQELRSVIGAVRLGADPAAAWLGLCREPGLAPLGQACARAVETGAPLAETVAILADDQRAARRSAAAEAARRAGVAAAAPLGLCFLPGFVLLGIVPVLVGMARTLLG